MDPCPDQVGGVVPTDAYQLFLQQDHQLRLLQAQVSGGPGSRSGHVTVLEADGDYRINVENTCVVNIFEVVMVTAVVIH